MHTLRTTLAALVALAAVCAAQTAIAGKWEGETDGGASIVLDLTVKGAELSGTLTRNGQSTSISEGKVAEKGFSFKATLGGQSETFSGEVSGETLRVWLDRQGSEKAVVFTRVKG
ncbi:MAG TPA: hypothetical protein VE379_04335 [Vicinamibacterales bacterium]|nr:hypothetical protein [Vicinamibacterales bacterium]